MNDLLFQQARREMDDDLHYKTGACSIEDLAPPEGMVTYPFERSESQ